MSASTAAAAPKRCDYLILGNSAAGVTAAEAIRENDAEGTIVIVSPEAHAAYGRPLISYLLEGKTRLERIGYKGAKFYEDLGVNALLGEGWEAVKIDGDAHEATLANGAIIGYGSCLIATGSIPFTPPIEGLAGKKNVCTFMTLDDALQAKSLAEAARKAANEQNRESHAIVIGAGLIGLKAAEAISHMVDRVTVLELAPRILPAVLDEQGAAILQKMLSKHGIECLPGVSAQAVLGDGDRAVGAILTNGEQAGCDFIVAAVGVRPNTAFAVESGAEQGRGLVCDANLMTSLPDVYAAGDVVQVTDAFSGAQRPLALWPNAVRQGRIAGEHMAGVADAEPFTTGFAVNAVDFFEASLLTSGTINPPADDESYQVEVMKDEEAGTYAKFVRKDGKLEGYILLNRPDRAGIYTALIENQTPLDTIDPGIFEATPENLDFSSDARWARLHKGYPEALDKRGWKAVDGQ